VLAASVAVHLLLFFFGGVELWFPQLPLRTREPLSAMRDTVPLVFFSRPRPEPRPPADPETPRRPARRRGTDPFVAAIPEQLSPPAPEPPPTDTGAAPAPAVSEPQPGVTPAPMARIGPDLGEGKLWVRPLPLPPRELARRLTKSHAELVDSAVTAVVQSFLDSVANDPGSRGTPMPDWTGRVAGKKFGLDSTSLYVAGLKIPAAVLALLPIPAGNIDQNRAYNRIMELRADIQQAAQRADNLAEFKERIKEIRLRKEREEEFERRRGEVPETPADPTPPAPPAQRDSSQGAAEKK
jgi:hypothetical protein